MAPSESTFSHSFISKKRKILEQLAIPYSDYDDLSPKGSVDEGIRDLIEEINQIEGCVTTSSCAGRVSIFLEGDKTHEKDEQIEFQDEAEDDSRERENQTRAGVGGKGGGGKWLYVSHEPLVWRHSEKKLMELFGLSSNSSLSRHEKSAGDRYIHFKFEPMILHILTASSQQAQVVLSAALQAGFRESGAINLLSPSSEPATPMVAIRSMGLSLESIIGCLSKETKCIHCMVPEDTLGRLMDIANDRFKENMKRIERFRSLLKKLGMNEGEVRRKGQDGEEWEDPQARRDRKRAEGLKRSQQIQDSRNDGEPDDLAIVNLQLLDSNHS